MNLSAEFRKHCEAISTDWRAKLGLQAYDRLSADDLAREFDATIKSIHDMPNLPQDAVEHFLQNGQFWAGIVVRDPLLILFNPNQSSARYESSIMEELAHVILRHPPELLIISPGKGRPNHNPHIEQEAKFLASCLILPRRGLQWVLQKKMVDEQIAKHYGTSLEMVRWRRNANVHYIK